MKKFKSMLSLTLSVTLVVTSGFYVPNMSIAAKASSVNAVTIDPSLQYQTIKGWGTSLAWWGDLVGKWSTSAKDELMDLAFSQDKGLGLNIVRYNIGGGENPNHNHMRPGGEIEGYEPSEGVWNWDADAGQRWVLQQAKKRIPSNDFISEAFSNSPPYWMTNSGCAAGAADGKNNLKDDKYTAFANYFTEVIKHFKENWGITFNTADPLNEPIADWWKANGTQEGCNFDRKKQADLINEVYKSMQSKGLTTTKISASDESSIDWSIDTLNSFNDETKSYIGQINTHEYSGSKRFKLRDLAATLNKPLYMDEICTGYGTHGHDNMDSGLALADYIFKDMRDMKVPAWEIWQVADDENQDVTGNSNWGLIHAYWSGDNVEKYYLTKQYYAMGHFSKFIKPGYKIIDANNPNVVAAYDQVSKNIVLVSRNTLSTDSTFSFDLSKFDLSSANIKAYRTTPSESLADISSFTLSKNYLNDTLPSKSMVTYVISNANYSGAIGTTSNDNVKGTGNNQFDYANSTTWNYYDGQTGAYSNDLHYTNTKDDYYKVNFTGNQVKIYGAKASDSGIAGISIDDKAETLVDMYSANRQDNSLIYTSPILTNGNHTIKVRATGDKNPSSRDCFIIADKVVSYEGATGTETLTQPTLTSLNPGDGRLTVVFSPVDGASSYNIKYGDSSGTYTTINNVTDNIYNITGLENGKKYYVVVSAVNNKGETVNSNELSEVPLPSDNPNLLYYVNAGDNNPLSLDNGEKLGTRNSSEDQSYGRDPVTGYHWGYIADNNKTWSQDNEASIGSNYGCLRQYDGYGKGKGLEYKFEVPNGRYFITIGFYDPWNNSNRKEDIIINGTIRDTNFVPGNKKTSKSYEANVTDGILSIKAAGSDDNCDHPMISWINVENYIPVSDITLNTNTLNIQTGNSETLSASISPENAQNKGIVWTSSDENIATVDQNGLVKGVKFGTATITATSVDGNKTAQCNITVLPQLKNITVNADKTILKEDSTSELTIQGTMTDESKADLSQALIEYSSDNEKVATINNKGIVTALSEGSSKIKVTVTLNGVTKESFIELTVDNTPPTFNLLINGNTLEENCTFEDSIPLNIKAWDELSGLQSAKIKIDNKDYVIDSNASSPISIDFAGKLGRHKATITAVDVAGNKLKKTFSFNVVTSIDSISQLLDHYTKSKEITGPKALQLKDDIAQAKHQLDKGRPDKASKYMSYFIIHLNINPFNQSIPRYIKNILNKDAGYMIFFPR